MLSVIINTKLKLSLALFLFFSNVINITFATAEAPMSSTAEKEYIVKFNIASLELRAQKTVAGIVSEELLEIEKANIILQTLGNAGIYPIKIVIKQGLVVILAEDLSKIENIIESDPDLIKGVSPNTRIKQQGMPNDQLFSGQHALHNTLFNNKYSKIDIDAPQAWSLYTGRVEVVVAVLDSGLYVDHPDLQGNIWTNSEEIPGNNLDDDQNGVVDDVYGYAPVEDFFPGIPERNSREGNVNDVSTHGTFVSGIIAAGTNNSQGISGVCGPNNNIKIMPVRVVDANGGADLLDLILGIQYVVNMKQQKGVNVAVINISSGTYNIYQEDGEFREALQSARDSGIIVVASAGNSANNNNMYPVYPASSSVDSVISVASVNPVGGLSSFSNYGDWSVHIAAPGESIISTQKPSVSDGQVYYYTLKNGTSYSAPVVSGVAALIASQRPTMPGFLIKQLLMKSVQPLPSLNGKVASKGIVNARMAITLAKKTFNITGKVLKNGKPVSGAIVDGGVLGKRKTNSTGSFSFVKIPSFTQFSFNVTKPGAAFSGQAEGVLTNTNKTLTIRL